mmetsp:Transcript_26966/g.48012  ORF Transcript_26966/g.48012 Transcript_26966/m.48012 type:complete len:212 (+) Transcript_26966:324-959(+)
MQLQRRAEQCYEDGNVGVDANQIGAARQAQGVHQHVSCIRCFARRSVDLVVHAVFSHASLGPLDPLADDQLHCPFLRKSLSEGLQGQCIVCGQEERTGSRDGQLLAGLGDVLRCGRCPLRQLTLGHFWGAQPLVHPHCFAASPGRAHRRHLLEHCRSGPQATCSLVVVAFPKTLQHLSRQSPEPAPAHVGEERVEPGLEGNRWLYSTVRRS